jgi:MFS family permease
MLQMPYLPPTEIEHKVFVETQQLSTLGHYLDLHTHYHPINHNYHIGMKPNKETVRSPSRARLPNPQLQTHLDPDSETDQELNSSKLNMLPTSSIKLPPTDHGIVPWLQVLGGFILMFNSWGILVSFGTFETYCTQENGISGEHDPSSIAWIGSLQAFFTLLGGGLSGKYFDAGFFRPMAIAGTLLATFGLMMTSLCTKYWQFILAQSLTTGIGLGLYVGTAVSLPSTWFTKRRGLAVGLVSTGSSVGGIIYPIVIHHLIPQIGFPWTARVVGFILLGTMILAISVLRQRLPPRKRGDFMEYRSLRDPVFALFNVGIFLAFLGFFTFYNFVESFVINTRIDSKGLPVFYILPIVNAASAFGRIIPPFVSDYVGPLNVHAPVLAISGILVFTWLPIHSIGPLMTISILYGFFSGAVAALPPASTASITADLTTLGGRLGVVFTAMAFGSLIGSPVTGAIIQSQNNYDGARIWGGVMLLAGASCLFLSRTYQTKWILWAKA